MNEGGERGSLGYCYIFMIQVTVIEGKKRKIRWKMKYLFDLFCSFAILFFPLTPSHSSFLPFLESFSSSSHISYSVCFFMTSPSSLSLLFFLIFSTNKYIEVLYDEGVRCHRSSHQESASRINTKVTNHGKSN